MPIVDEKYVSPTWSNDSGTKINASEMQAITDTIEKNQNEKYEKPSDGIPKTDLSSDVQESIDNAVTYTAQTLTDDQKAQARDNIGAAAPDGYYGDSGGTFQYAKNFEGYLTRQNADDVVFRPTASKMIGSAWQADSISGKTATIEKIKGKTLVFNQLVQNGDFATESGWSASNGTITVDDNILTFTGNSSIENKYVSCHVSNVNEHKYFVAFSYQSNNTLTCQHVGGGNILCVANEKMERKSVISTGRGAAYRDWFFFNYDGVTDWILKLKDVICIDLTQMYGAGNEPTTVEEFKAQFPLDYYAYNPGELISLNATGLKTVGFNQWDEEWEYGGINSQTGENMSSTVTARSKNFIPMFDTMQYYVKSLQSVYTRYYDANKKYIGQGLGSVKNGVITPPQGTKWFRFVTDTAIADNSICINFSWSGVRNGEYEPYWDSTLTLSIADYFPDGMKSAGTVYDELTKDKAIKRIGKYTFTGTEPWISSGSGYYFLFTDEAKRPVVGGTKAKIRHSFLTTTTANELYLGSETSGIALNDNGALFISSADYAQKSSLTGTVLYYEIKDENVVETPINPPLNLTYRCDDFGTEMLLPQNTADSMLTAPLDMEVIYGLDYEATVRNLPINYTNNSFVLALKDALRAVDIDMQASNDDGQWHITMAKILPKEVT